MRKMILVQIFIIISCLAQAEVVDTSKTEVENTDDFLNTDDPWVKQLCYKDGLDTAGNQKTKIGKKKSFDNFELLVGSALGCDITITANEGTTEGEDSPNTRRFNFKTDGSLYITNHVTMTDDQVRAHWKYKQLIKDGVTEPNAFNQVKKSDFQKSGVKDYYFHPKIKNQEIFIHNETKEIKVITQNGKTIFFDPKTGLINEEKTIDLTIKQTPLVPGTDTISITSPEMPLITFPFSQGEYSKNNPKTPVTIEHLGKICKLEAKHVFNYLVACSNEKESVCICDEKDTDKKKNCSVEAPKIEKVKAHLLNGVTIKNDYPTLNKNIKNNCPDFPDTTYIKPKEEVPSPHYLESEVKVEAPTEQVEDEKEKEEDKKEEVVVAPNTTDECQKKLLDYFNDDKNQELKNQYMIIQGQIALQRLAWTYQKMTKENTLSVQDSIVDLLKKRNPKLHAEFIKASPTKSRNEKINMAMQELRIESNTFVKTKDDLAYSIHHSDIKMIELLANAEKLNGKSFDGGIMDFTSLIEHGVAKLKGTKDEDLTAAKEQIDQLIKKKEVFEKQISEHLKSVDCGNTSVKRVCKNGSEETLDLTQSLDDAKELIEHIYKDDTGKKKELHDIYQWNNYWLDTK